MATDRWMLSWNAWGLFGLVPLIMCSAMGAFVFATRPNRAQNRRLALFLVAGSIVTFAGPPGAAFAASNASARVFYVTHLVGLFLTTPLLLRFLATIDTPLARPLATRLGLALPWLLAVAEVGFLTARPTLFIEGFREPWWGGRMMTPGPFANIAYGISAIAPLYSLAVAISAYRRAAQGTPAKERARRYAIAFGFNDAVLVFVTAIVPGVYSAVLRNRDIRSIEFLFVWAIPVGTVGFVILMAYGILRTQLFDIDLRLAAGLRRGVLGAIVLFAFFAAAKIAETVVSEEFGYVIGAFAAAAVLLVHKPAERFAASLSKAVLPGAEPSPAYVAFRKLEVYSEAVEAAYEDGHLSRADRLILTRLQAKLEIEPGDARRLEEDARQARARTTRAEKPTARRHAERR